MGTKLSVFALFTTVTNCFRCTCCCSLHRTVATSRIQWHHRPSSIIKQHAAAIDRCSTALQTLIPKLRRASRSNLISAGLARTIAASVDADLDVLRRRQALDFVLKINDELLVLSRHIAHVFLQTGQKVQVAAGGGKRAWVAWQTI